MFSGLTGGVSVAAERGPDASAPGDVALKNLGYNVDNVLDRARALL